MPRQDIADYLGLHDRDGVAHDDAPRKKGCDCAADIPTGRATQPFRIEPKKCRLRDERKCQRSNCISARVSCALPRGRNRKRSMTRAGGSCSEWGVAVTFRKWPAD